MRIPFAQILSGLLAAIASPSIVSGQRVWTVDFAAGGAGALHATIQLAAPGDILHILPGTYGRAVLGRSMHLIAEPGSACHQVLVQGLPAGENVTILGLDLVGIPGTSNPPEDAPLRLEACSGDVFVSSLAISGRRDVYSTRFGSVAGAAIEVAGGRLHGENLRVQGVQGGSTQISTTFGGGFSVRLEYGGLALNATAAKVTLSGCVLRGGDGGSVSWFNFPCSYFVGEPGRMAILAADSLVVLDRCDLGGGSGGDGNLVQCQNVWQCGSFAPRMEGGQGAPGLASRGTSALVLTGGTALHAGAGGRSVCGRPAAASALGDPYSGGLVVTLDPGVRLVPEPGAPGASPAVMMVTRRLPSLTSASPRASLGAPVRWTHSAAPGDFAWWLLSDTLVATASHSVVLGGIDVAPVPWWTYGPWVVPSSGSVSLQFVVPVDPALLYQRLFVQSVGLDPSLFAVGTAVTAVVVGS